MATLSNFEELEVWKKARSLCQKIYSITDYEKFSKDYRFVAQIRAAAGSIMDNIAEGFEHENNKEFIRFLYISKGSCGEIRSQLIRANDCHYISDEELIELKNSVLELSSNIFKFIQYLQKGSITGNKHNSK